PHITFSPYTRLFRSRIKAAAVSAALKDQLGRPLPLVDFNAIRADLAAFPLIRSFSTESHPPSTLVVRIVERVPVGVITDGKTFRDRKSTRLNSSHQI